MKFLFAILLATLLLTSCSRGGSDDGVPPVINVGDSLATPRYGAFMEKDSKELLEMGERFLFTTLHPDSALICYSIVADRFRPDMGRDEVAICLEGIYGRLMTEFFGLYNYSLPISDLRRAKYIVDRWNLPAAKLDYIYGISYIVMGSTTDDRRLYLNAAAYLRRSFRVACESGDYRTIHRSFDNLVSACSGADSMSLMKDEYDRMLKLREPEQWRQRQSVLIYRQLEARRSGNRRASLELTDSMIAIVPRCPQNYRYLASAFMRKAQDALPLELWSEYESAADSALAYSYRYNMPDVRSNMLWSIDQYLTARGDTAAAQKAYLHYLELKDSISNESMMVNLEARTLGDEVERMQSTIDFIDTQSRLKSWLLALVLLLLAITLASAVILSRMNRKLTSRSKLLYQQLRNALSSGDRWIVSPSGAGHGRPEKYSGSGLTDTARRDLAAKISEIVLESDAILNPDFSLADLAEAVGVNRTYVSQTINEHFHCSFRILVNRARVREAMRRLDANSPYSYYSVEGIAESVGFRSRSSFSAWFRKFTGLGAAEYRRLSKSCDGSVDAVCDAVSDDGAMS